MSEGRVQLAWDVYRARKEGTAGVARRQRRRFIELVAHARARSPYYRDLYSDLPERVDDPSALPVTDKKALMGHFDEFVTDRAVSLKQARAFVADPSLIGERFLGKYVIAMTSGTTGTPGIFLLDDRTLAVTNAVMLRVLGDWLDMRDVLRIVWGRARMSMVMASGGHFASATAAGRIRKSRLGRSRLQVLSAHMPMPQIVDGLNRFRPAVVAPYASMAALLASEQEAGRLRIDPVLLALSAEGLPIDEYERISRVFRAKVGNSYAASECTFLSYNCDHHWLHVNSDWAMLEPVDADYRPTPPGEVSHTVLLSNLANRVQPILRYDLGDSVLLRPDPCPCGNPLPAIQVKGRSADVLTFPDKQGETVTIAPLAFGTLLDRIPHIELSQIVQTAPAALRVRLRLEPGAGADGVWGSVQGELTQMLAEHGLQHVSIERGEEPPEQSAGGKFRAVIPLT